MNEREKQKYFDLLERMTKALEHIAELLVIP